MLTALLFLALSAIITGFRIAILQNFAPINHENYMKAANDLLIGRPARGQLFCLGAAIYYTPELGVHKVNRATGPGGVWALILIRLDQLLGYLMWFCILITGLIIFFQIRSWMM